MKKEQKENARAALECILIVLCLTPGVPVALSRVIQYEAIPHVEAKEAPEPAEFELVELPPHAKPEWMEHLFKEAERYGANPEKMIDTITCESAGWQSEIQSWHRYKEGGQEQSFGLAQIHLPHWPEITKEQAKDPYFAISFMAEKFGENKGTLWSCYKDLFGRSASNI